MPKKIIAVIGGGASGTLVSAQLLASRPFDPQIDLQIEWIGNENSFGPGLAYGTREPLHLLNVPVRGMSAFVEQPGHFMEWLERHHPELQAEPESFVPRMHYGEYLSQLIPRDSPSLSHRSDEAIDLEKWGEHYRITLKSGARMDADEVVLALGGLSSLPGQSTYRALRPWQLDQLPGDARVLLIGTGLTMIDVALSLHARDHTGILTAVSPQALLPRSHSRFSPRPPGSASLEFRALFKSSDRAPLPRLSRALRVFRSECRSAQAQGSDWRTVFDEIRPHTAELWSGLSVRQKKQFYRHLRPFWDVHRHRIAPPIAEKLREFQEQGILRVQAARVPRTERPSSIGDFSEAFDAFVDCTGFSAAITRVNHPLLQSLIRRELVVVDDPPLGVSIHPSEHSRLHLIGALLRGSLWESIAIPEIRAQAARIVGQINAGPAGQEP